MLPILALSASHPGIAYINGCFAGEIDADQPLIRPINVRGAVYLDYRPLSDACLPMARRLVFSGGAPLSESVEQAGNMNVVIWPGGVTEIELAPRPHAAPVDHFQLDGYSFTLDASSMQLSCNARPLSTLPPGAKPPEFRRLTEGVVLTGSCDEGKYLITTDSALQRQTGFLRARQLDIEADGRIRAVAAAHDLVGHATLEIWRLTPEGLMLLSSEPAWLNGAPQWPKTPEETARAAVEAALAGLDAEAELYLTPSLRMQSPLAEIRSRCDLCVEMKYASADARPCVGLLALESENMARVRPLYYRASPGGGPQGAYQIDSFEFQ